MRQPRTFAILLFPLLFLAIFVCDAKPARAQRRHLDVQRFVPALDDAGFLGIDGTRTPGPGRLSLALFSDASWDPVEAEVPGRTLTPVDVRIMTHLSAELGIGGRTALAVRLPMVAYQRGDALAPGRTLDSFAVSDPSVLARYRLLGPSASRADIPVDGPGLALQLGASIPVGHDDAFAGEGALRAEATLLGDFQLLGAGIGGSLGIRHRFEGRTISSTALDPTGAAVTNRLARYRDEMTFGAALKIPLPPVPDIVAVLETRGATDFRSAETTNLELDLAARVKLGDFTVTLGGGLGLTRGLGTPDARALLGLWWSPPDTDTDGDGIPDSRDECPFLAEDLDGYQDEDGCPDLDNDGDLVPDVDDLCPHDPAEEGFDEDEDGCTDTMSHP